MGIVIKQGLKASVASYFGVAVGAFNNLYLFPKVIGAEGIGIINIISAAATLFLPLLQLGFTTSLVKYFPVFKDKPYAGTFVTYAFLIPLLALGLFVISWPFTQGLFAWLFEENANVIFQNIHWVLPLTGILLFFALFEALAKANFKIVFPTLVRNLIWRLSMTAGVALLAFDYLEYDQLSEILVGSWLFSLICITIYIFAQGDFKFQWKKGIHKLKEIKEFNSFSGYVILLSLGGILIQRIDQLMVTSYLGTSAAGVFSTAMYFATLIEIPKRSVMGIISPILVDSFKSHDIKQVDQLYKKSSLNLLIIGGILFVGIWINVWDIFDIIPKKEEFLSGVFVVFFYCLARVVDMGMGCNSEIIVYSKYYKVNVPMQLVLIAIVTITNVIFIPMYGITGAAIATCASVLIYNVIRFGFLYLKMGIQPFTKSTLIVVGLLATALGVGEFIEFDWLVDMNSSLRAIVNISVRSTLVVIPLILVVYFLKLSTDLNNSVNGILKKFKVL